MIYDKPALTQEDQADRLLARGLIADRNELVQRLKAVNYYRLSGYFFPFRRSDHTFEPGTSLEMVWRRYNFDRRLRIVLLDAIERIEVAVRTRLVYQFVQEHGPFGHLNEKNLPGFKKKRQRWKQWWRNAKALLKLRGLEETKYKQWLNKMKNEKARASEVFVKHFEATYGDKHQHLPLWMACELMTCGIVQELAHGMESSVLKKVAADFGFPDQQLFSWMNAVFSLRNVCAHHARVWNRIFGVKPSIPGKNKNPLWHLTPGFANDRVGLLLTVCHHWLGKISSTTTWKARLFDLFDEYPDIPLNSMGMPVTWRTHALWI